MPNLYEDDAGFYQRALAALAHYDETGLHLTAEEANAWLAALEAGETLDPPECHLESGLRLHWPI